MKYYSAIISLLLSSSLLAQLKSIDSNKTNVTKPLMVSERTEACGPEETPIFCGLIEVEAQVKDLRHWLNYLTKSFLLDSLVQNKIPDGIYNITAYFIIDKEGMIKEVKVKNDPGYGLAEKVITVISNYKEKWYPAIRNGRIVKAYKQQVITIAVGKQECSQVADEEIIL